MAVAAVATLMGCPHIYLDIYIEIYVRISVGFRYAFVRFGYRFGVRYVFSSVFRGRSLVLEARLSLVRYSCRLLSSLCCQPVFVAA